jgi:minor histocompatibility antigen H13
VIGPLLLALLRRELGEFWSYSDLPEDEAKRERDETIEAGSEIAAKAREEARAKAEVAEAAEIEGSNGMPEQIGEGGRKDEAQAATAFEDESWMDGEGVVKGDDGKARRRKGRKK